MWDTLSQKIPLLLMASYKTKLENDNGKIALEKKKLKKCPYLKCYNKIVSVTNVIIRVIVWNI